MSIREALASAVESVEQTESQTIPAPAVAPATPAAPAAQEKPSEAAPSQAEKPGRTAGRPRDEHGRLLPGKPEKPEAAPAAAVQAATPAKPASPPPSSWKKDHWEGWQKIAVENPALAEYINQRESEFARGVSTYKQEYDSVRPMVEAMQPLLPVLQQYGVQPAQWIQSMGQAHHSLLFGTPAQKLQMFAKLAQDYQVPLQALYDPNAQQQFLMQQTLTPSPAQPQRDVREVVQEQLTEVFARQDLERFQKEKDSNGNPLYPHYEAVRNTMAQLLEAGIAQDLKDAYPKAIRMHDDIWEAEQQAKQTAAQKATQAAQAAQVAKAKAAAVSPRTATPGAGAAPAKPKGIRSAIEAAVEANSAEGGRV